jgi:hypothetical protein
MSTPTLPVWAQRVARRWTFGPLPPNADGWYVWRNSPTWPKRDYKCIEIARGIMVDTEPMDSHGAQWRVVECQPYGQFRGPILPR